jgi:hypothetical protein
MNHLLCIQELALTKLCLFVKREKIYPILYRYKFVFEIPVEIGKDKVLPRTGHEGPEGE